MSGQRESERVDGPPVPDADPLPKPPEEPELGDCCGSGCNPCVFDLHDLAMERYRQALRAWHERHPQAPPSPR